MLAADHKRQVQLTKALKLVKRLQTQMADLQRQQGPAKGPAHQRGPHQRMLEAIFYNIIPRAFQEGCPKLKSNNNHGNQGRNGNAPANVYVVGRAGTDPDSNVVMGTFLLNNRYASILFDTGVDRSFVSTAFSSQIDITPTALDHYYDVELADGKIIGDRSNRGHEARLHIISYTKTREYMLKGCPVFLANVNTKETEDKSEKKRLEDVPIIQDFPDVFLQRLAGSLFLRLKQNKQEHEEHLKLILELLTKEDCNAKFFHVRILGFPKYSSRHKVIDSQGIPLDPSKIESIKDWASPKSPTEIRQFLGLAGYCRRFIEGFSKIAKPMTKLTQKKVKFEWGDIQETSCSNWLKQNICSATNSGFTWKEARFIVYCDASIKGLGVVLMQREKVIAYASR
ncbi:putative reverse transcriptase domain-containing protein [Tanacetum coccineum]|uniref:Reverse transcriptase domain-containing protein n=1 Tax=Tanacetum coccineum TaxID=301880 RepID=A0ABQ5C2A7_9ASTR